MPDDPIREYPMGQEVRLAVDFEDETQDPPVAGNPDTVQLLILQGDEVETILTIVQAALSNPSTGRWEYRYTIPLDGDKAIKPWTYRYEGASAPGGITAVKERRFYVPPSKFYPPS